MAVTIQEVRSRKDLHIFIHLPERIHSSHSNWVHPIYFDEWAFYNPVKNRFYAACDTILLLAYKKGTPVGRIMGIINHKYNTIHHEKNGRFFALECYNDIEMKTGAAVKA